MIALALISLPFLIIVALLVSGGRSRERDRLLRQRNRLLAEHLSPATQYKLEDVLDEVARMHGIKPRDRNGR